MPTVTGQAQVGTGLPLCYGRVVATGQRVIDYTIPILAWTPSTIHAVNDLISDTKQRFLYKCTTAGSSGSSYPDLTTTIGNTTTDGTVVWTNEGYLSAGQTYGIWLLGEGEWDGFDVLWNMGTEPVQPFAFDYGVSGRGTCIPWGPNPPTVHFHEGTDTPVGTVITPTSNGGDQLCDNFFTNIPSATPRLCYSGIAYLALEWQPQNWQGSSASLQPIGHWRTTKCRIFDGSGNQTGYEFTTNPAWHFVDAYIRRKLLPRSEYTITLSGLAALPSDVTSKFDWGSVYQFSQDCDYILGGGQKRFEGNYAFTGQATLASILETTLLCSRGYMQEYAGKIYLQMDKPRASVFTMTNDMLIPGTFNADETKVHAAGNWYTINFLDMELPAVSQVSSITNVAGAGYGGNDLATIVTVDENPCAQWDIIWVGGNSNSALNYPYYVTAIIDAHTFSAEPLNPRGSGSGTGGVIGYPQSQFSKRNAQILHQRHAEARGQIGEPVGTVVRQRKLPVALDLASMTWDQQNRLAQYEVYRELGLDASPWQPPVQILLRARNESVDASGNILKAAQCGNLITLDSTVSDDWAGTYEVIERRIFPDMPDPSSVGVTSSGGTSATLFRSPSQDSGTIELLLRTYNPSVFPDTSQTPTFATVPGGGIWWF